MTFWPLSRISKSVTSWFEISVVDLDAECVSALVDPSFTLTVADAALDVTVTELPAA